MAKTEASKLTPPEIVEAVDAWLSEHDGAQRRAAFAAVAERTGRTPNGVAQSYYSARRRARGTDTPNTAMQRRRRPSTSPRLSAKPSAAIRSLTEHVEALEREVEELRAFRAAVLAVLS